MRRSPGAGRLGGSLAVAAALHATAIAALVFARPRAAAPLPPIYRVDIVAAPPGPRAVGTVAPPPATPVPPAPVPPRAESRAPMPTVPSPAPSRAPARRPPAPATPVPPVARPTESAAPQAGGGPTGGRGADVANIRTQGIQFPYPAYLNNIVRQIALNFAPASRGAPLRAEVRFLVHRDGSVTDLTVVTRSGNYAFDLDAQGAVEAAAAARAFGPLPAGFRDDVLPVVFSFDPSLLR